MCSYSCTYPVIFLQQTMDEMGDILEERPHGRHIIVFNSDSYADSIAG